FTGSFCRGIMSKSSDLDLRIFHDPGFANSLRAYYFASTLRLKGLLLRFPVDVYCFSNLEFLNKLEKSEVPVSYTGSKRIQERYSNPKNFKDTLRELRIT
ncbi:hypothetical protein OAG91_01970, partial [bacterium]|nr:hypothetical protein [bacterium]